MIETLKRFFKIGEYSEERTFGSTRSSEWPRIRREFAKYVPMVCPFSGSTSVQLHHSQAPFHADPSRELDPTQLRWVAEKFHIEEGHNGDFKSLNFTFDERLDAYQGRKYWNGSAWVPNDKPRIKYKLTEEELQEWNKTFGTNWAYPSV